MASEARLEFFEYLGQLCVKFQSICQSISCPPLHPIQKWMGNAVPKSLLSYLTKINERYVSWMLISMWWSRNSGIHQWTYNGLIEKLNDYKDILPKRMPSIYGLLFWFDPCETINTFQITMYPLWRNSIRKRIYFTIGKVGSFNWFQI